MDDRMADSQMLGDIRSDAFEEGCKFAEQKLISYIEGVRDWLRNLAEDRTLPMDVKVHSALWQEIQSIDHNIETKFKEVKPNDILPK